VAKLKKYIGRMTNNVAEVLRGLTAAMDYAQSHGIRALRIESDSELLVKQMRGQYKVKSEDLRPLFERAQKMSKAFDSLSASSTSTASRTAKPTPSPTKRWMKQREKLPERRPQKRRKRLAPKPNRPAPNRAPKNPGAFPRRVLYLLEDVELPDGMVVDVSIHLRPKPPA